MTNNTTNNHHDITNNQSDHFIIHIFFVIQISEATVVTSANILVIALYLTMKVGPTKISNFLMVSQAVTDLFLAIATWFQVLTYVERFISTYVLHLIYAGMLEYSLILCLGVLLIGAVERYLCITKPLYHKYHVTKLRLTYLTGLVWVASLIPPFSLLTIMQFSNNTNSGVVKTYSYIFDGVMICIIIFVVTLLLLSLKRANASCDRGVKLSISQQRSVDVTTDCRRNPRVVEAYKKKVRVIVIFIIMISAYVVTFLPFTIGRILYDVNLLRQLSHNDQKIVNLVCDSFYKSSAIFNPLLTMFLKDDYRVTLMNVVKIRRRQSKCKRRRGLQDVVTSSLTSSLFETSFVSSLQE